MNALTRALTWAGVTCVAFGRPKCEDERLWGHAGWCTEAPYREQLEPRTLSHTAVLQKENWPFKIVE